MKHCEICDRREYCTLYHEMEQCFLAHKRTCARTRTHARTERDVHTHAWVKEDGKEVGE